MSDFQLGEADHEKRSSQYYAILEKREKKRKKEDREGQ